MGEPEYAAYIFVFYGNYKNGSRRLKLKNTDQITIKGRDYSQDLSTAFFKFKNYNIQ
jgi:hypothetical protein